MRIESVSEKEPQVSNSQNNDFKEMLKITGESNKIIKGVKGISSTTRYERNSKKSEIVKRKKVRPIFSACLDIKNNKVINGGIISGLDELIDNNKEIKINFSDLTLKELDLIYSVFNRLYLSVNKYVTPEKEAVSKEVLEEKEFFFQEIYQTELMYGLNQGGGIIRRYKVYYKGEKYYFYVDENGILNEGEENDCS